jgi:hypothetical protein
MEERDMPPKTRFVIHIGCDTAEQVLDVLNHLKTTEGVTVAGLQTGMNEAGMTRGTGERGTRTNDLCSFSS